jgi:hypothetical protein
MSHFRNVNVAFQEGTHLDGAGRLRVSLPFSVTEHSFDYGTGSTFWDATIVGGGSSVAHQPNSSSVLLTAGTGAADSVIRQTFRYFHYRPGKSQAAEVTGVFGAAVANVRRRMGYFDASDGIFLEQNGTTDVAIVRRTSTSGAPVETRVTQANWSEDKFDGSLTALNPSKATLDLSKGVVFTIDLLWYGYGDVRVGFNHNGRFKTAHIFRGFAATTVPYMKTGSLPLRYEITNLAAQGVAHTLLQTCAQIISEDGQQEPPGVVFSTNVGTLQHAVTTQRALLSIRPKATLGGKTNRVESLAEFFSLLVGTNDCLWEIQFAPVFTGVPVWTSANAASSIEFSIHTDAAAGALTTPGTVLASGYQAAGSGAARIALTQAELRTKAIMHLDMAGANPTAVSVVATSRTGTSNISAAMDWREVL